MSTRNNRKVTYLTDDEAAQLSRWASDTGKSESHLLREAVLEYLDRDRSDRVEGKLETLEAKLDEIQGHLSDDTTHTHKDSGTMNSGTEAIEKAREIIRRLQSNHDEVLKNDAVVRAIEDIAGIDDRTIRKYKRLFRKRGLLFEHPGQPPLWTVDSTQWLSWMQDFAQLNGKQEADKIVDEYPARVVSNMDGGLRIELTEEQ